MKLRHPRHTVLAVALLVCAAVQLAAQAAPQRGIRITLLQVNDVYQISPVDRGTRGGLAHVAALRKKILAESPHTLLLLAGDTISPSVASNMCSATTSSISAMQCYRSASASRISTGWEPT